jgi:hypothetical protein
VTAPPASTVRPAWSAVSITADPSVSIVTSAAVPSVERLTVASDWKPSPNVATTGPVIGAGSRTGAPGVAGPPEQTMLIPAIGRQAVWAWAGAAESPTPATATGAMARVSASTLMLLSCSTFDIVRHSLVRFAPARVYARLPIRNVKQKTFANSKQEIE